MVAGRLLLFVGMLVFLVDDDQPQRVHRSKHRRTGPDDNPSAPLPDLVPLVMTFPG